jgi:hypothetical protein
MACRKGDSSFLKKLTGRLSNSVRGSGDAKRRVQGAVDFREQRQTAQQPASLALETAEVGLTDLSDCNLTGTSRKADAKVFI